MLRLSRVSNQWRKKKKNKICLLGINRVLLWLARPAASMARNALRRCPMADMSLWLIVSRPAPREVHWAAGLAAKKQGHCFVGYEGLHSNSFC